MYKRDRHRKMLQIYKSRDEVETACEQHSLTITAYIHGAHIYASIKGNERVRIITTPLNQANMTLMCLKVNDNTESYRITDNEKYIEYCVLVPVHHQSEKTFMIITSSWNIT